MNNFATAWIMLSLLYTHYFWPLNHRDMSGRQMSASAETQLNAENIVLQAANKLILAGKYAEAERILTPAVDTFGQPGGCLRRQLAECMIRQGRPGDALHILRYPNPDRSDYAKLGYLEAAVGDKHVSRKMWDDFPKVHEIRRSNYPFEGNWPDVDQPDGLKAAWLIACGVITGTGDPRGGDFYLNAAQKLVPNNPILLNLLGNEAFGAHRYAEAANYFERAARDAVGRLKDRCESDAKMARLIADGYKKLGKGGS
jgi:tetratricopeptide (TPR) repeat protein